MKEAGFGGLLNIGLCYAFGIVFAIIVAAPVSGGHLSPSFTIAFTIFKGFPLRKVPYYVSHDALTARSRIVVSDRHLFFHFRRFSRSSSVVSSPHSAYTAYGSSSLLQSPPR